MENPELPQEINQLNIELNQEISENQDRKSESKIETYDTKEDNATVLVNINQEISKNQDIIDSTMNSLNIVRDNLELPPTDEIPYSIQNEHDLVEKLNNQKIGIEKELEIDPDSSMENNEFDLVKEEWRKSAEGNFGIKDFNIETFKRTLFNRDAISQAFSDGKDWDYIFDNLDNFTDGEAYNQAENAFDSMSELESELSGSVKNLHEKFGIVNFQRYPKEILINQLSPIDNEKGVGVLAFAESDYNGAFDNQKEIWEKIYDTKKDVLNFRIVECGSSFDLARQFLKIKNDTNKNISLAVISAHSEPEGFYLGDDGDNKSYVNKEMISEFQAKTKEIFADGAQLVGNACSSGAIGGWINDVSKSSRISAAGPDKPAAIEDVDFHNDEIIPKYYDNDIYSNYKNGFLLSKKRKQ